MNHHEAVAVAGAPFAIRKVCLVGCDVEKPSCDRTVEGALGDTLARLCGRVWYGIETSFGSVAVFIRTAPHVGSPVLSQEGITMNTNSRHWGAHDLLLTHGTLGRLAVRKTNKSPSDPTRVGGGAA